eukprot:TRINITY_DN550_c1_g7_i1.p1 TRINITY_DN550_c1_g7~~TRINITY_DN550_c1_g7_i1.p1  ORF type:complete len:311 (-),score=32.54 TRINITY_DN550_c1_g7_i1:27-959(-)
MEFILIKMEGVDAIGIPKGPYSIKYKMKLLVDKIKQLNWSQLPKSQKITIGFMVTTIVWFSTNGLLLVGNNRKPLKLILPSLLAAYSQLVGLVGVTDIHDELQRNLGVRPTLPKLYQIFSGLGYLFGAIGHMTISHTSVGRVYLVFNVMFTCVYTYMSYLTLVYNKKVESPSKAFDTAYYRPMGEQVNVMGLVGWVAMLLSTGYIWMNEGRKSLTSTYKSEILASIGFLLTSIGTMRAGFNACMSSSPNIQPFEGAIELAISSLLAGLSFVPLYNKSPIANIYIAGYASVLYSSMINAYYAYKQENRAKL